MIEYWLPDQGEWTTETRESCATLPVTYSTTRSLTACSAARCFAQGETFEEALAEASDAMDEAFAARITDEIDVPKPSIEPYLTR